MRIVESLPYVPGRSRAEEYPLQRFLPSIPEGIVDGWLRANLEPGRWVIDPFGTSPQLPFEIVDAGYSVIVVCNNPVLQLIIEVMASAPSENDFHTALAAFAKEKHQNERLESHLQSLYETSCPKCSQSIRADAFIWKKGEPLPTSKLITCSFCKNEGEFPVSREDILKLESIGNDALHRARALQSVNINPDAQAGAEEVVNTYLARPLYFLFTLINRIDRMQIGSYHKKLLQALLVHAFDLGNSIWPWPVSRTRPKMTSSPPQFVEHNLWHALEGAIHLWCHRDAPVSFSVWPDLPETPGICLFKGRIAGLKSLEQVFAENPLTAVTVFPRPNQAFWSLSAVWAGWLWGKQAAHAMRGALERRRFDWFWFSNAIHQSLLDVQQVVGQEGILFGLLPEVEAGFLAAGIIAAEYAGLNLQGIAFRSEIDLAQCIWKSDIKRIRTPRNLENLNLLEPVNDIVTTKNEPVDRMNLYLACLAEIARQKIIPVTQEALPYYIIKEYQQKILSFLDDPKTFHRYRIQLNQSEHTALWPKNLSERPNPTLSDQIEHTVYHLFQSNDLLSFDAVDETVCEKFRGLLTPTTGLIRTCLAAYGSEIQKSPGVYRLKNSLEPTGLRSQIQALQKELQRIGETFGFQVTMNIICKWENKLTGIEEMIFHIIPDAAIGGLVFQDHKHDHGKHVVLFPDHVVNLLEYKLAANPRLLEALKKFGRLVPFSRVSKFGIKDEICYSDFLNLLEHNLSALDGPSQISIFN